MKKILVFFALSVIGFSSEGFAQKAALFFDEADALFSTYVSNGKVDYLALNDEKESLKELLELAAEVRVSASDANSYQAFWINAYNLAVLKGVLDNYPLKSPLDKAGFFDRTKYTLGGTTITLNDIENKMLRAIFKDARVHFVLVCGANGCPPIISKAYRPENVQKLLEQQTIKALNNSSFIKVSDRTVALSEIFKWYKEDFVSEHQSEIDFLNTYRKEKIAPNSKITYYSYDWRLNSK